MYRGRTIDDLLSDPLFLSSQEYKNYKDLVDAGVYPSVRAAILSILESIEIVKTEDRAAWPDEIKAAVEAESNGKVFPPLLKVASCIRDADFHAIPEEHWNMLADFLAGEHRGRRGRPEDDFNLQCEQSILEKYEKMLKTGFKPDKAKEELSRIEDLDKRTIERTIKRAVTRRENKLLMDSLAKLDMSRFFTDDT